MAQYSSASYLYFIAITVSLGSLYGGIIQSLLNAALLQVEVSLDWEEDQDDFRMGVATCLIPLGSIFGALTAGYLTDGIGRRVIMMVADFIILASFWLTYFENFYLFCTGRFIQGYSTGMNSIIASLYLRELAPPEISGFLVGINKIASYVGATISYSFAFFLPLTATATNHFWEIMFGLPAFFAAIRLILFFSTVTFDTPRYYFINDRGTEAKAVISEIYLEEHAQDVYNRESVVETALGFSDVLSINYRYQLLMCLFTYITAVYMGQTILNSYSTIIFLGTNNDENNPPPTYVEQVRLFNLSLGLIKVIAVLAGSYLIDGLGRRFLIVWGNIVVTLALSGFVVFGLENLGLEQRIDVLLFAMAAGLSYSIVNSVYLPEVLPAKGITVVTMVDLVNQVIMTLLFPIIADTPTKMIWAFGLFAVVGVLSAPVLWLYFIETKNLRLHEIYERFQAELEMEKVDKDKDETSGLLKETQGNPAQDS